LQNSFLKSSSSLPSQERTAKPRSSLSSGSLLCRTGTSIWFSDNSGNGCREEFELCLVIAIAFFPIPLFPRGGENRIETKQSGSEELIQRGLFREAQRDLLFTWTVLCSILQLQTDGMVEAGMGLDVGNTRVHGVEIGVALMESVSEDHCN
jgi:hypothetical protein